MSLELSYPAFYAEITCLTSPHPKKRFTVETARIQLVGMPFPVFGSYYGNEIQANLPFPRVREIELLEGYPKYDVKRHTSECRFFISFKGLAFNDGNEFLAYAKKEIERANRIISAVLPPHAAPIKVEKVLYVADSENQMRPVTEDYETGESVRMEVVNDVEIVNRWNEMVTDIVARRNEILFDLLEKESEDPVLEKCIGLIAENTYSSFSNALEILKECYGGHHKFIKMPGIDKEDVSVFGDNAQVYRHATHKLTKREMPLAEAKLFMLKLLRFYIENPVAPGASR
jgi:hypothetical protein